MYLSLPMRRATGEFSTGVREALDKAAAGEELNVEDGEALLMAEGKELRELIMLADHVRAERVGEIVTFVINRNINFTNVCMGTCRFCAFRRQAGDPLAYRLTEGDIEHKVAEAVRDGATEVCIQGGLHPEMVLDDYVGILESVRRVSPDIHIHAFSPAEIDRIARVEGIDVRGVLLRLKEAGLNSVPGTAAEVFSPRVRAAICPDKIGFERWAEIVRTCHGLGLPTTATVLYGTVERPGELAEHIALIREIQRETGGFTEFIPLRFSPFNTPLWHEGIRPRATIEHSL
ncbi:MAG: CofH family radical SAM protein, partial [Candidatus Hadarchaeales archaeon]